MDIYRICIENQEYRKILHTDKYVQLTVMSLPPAKDIPYEKHHGSQIITVYAGMAYVKIDGMIEKHLTAGMIVIVPPKTGHYVKSIGKTPLKLTSVYSPPEHQSH